MIKPLNIFLVFVFIFSGCHTIRPVASPTAGLISDLPQVRASAELVIDHTYQTYISKDRGNALADPQTYHIGEALAPLTEAYFEKSFDSIALIHQMPGKNEVVRSEYIVHPQITNFENFVRLGGQTITVSLSADVYDKNKNLMRSVNVQGTSRGEIGVFKSSELASETVSRAIQLALVNMLKELETSL